MPSPKKPSALKKPGHALTRAKIWLAGTHTSHEFGEAYPKRATPDKLLVYALGILALRHGAELLAIVAAAERGPVPLEAAQ